MKMPTVLLNSLLVFMFFSLSSGALLQGIYRTSTTDEIGFAYLQASLVLIGLPLLILGIFILLPYRWQLWFIENTWLRSLPSIKSQTKAGWLLGIMLVIFGCGMVYLGLK